MVTDQQGEITPASDEGVYARDTRFISDYHLYINREPWTLLTSSQVNFYTSRFHLTNPKLSTQDGELEPNTIGLTLERTVGEGIHEDFYIANYNNKQINFVLELAIHSDFADLFEVKAHRPAHMVQTILGLRADAPRKRLYVNPTLPTWLPAIEFRDIRVGSCSISPALLA